ncbi:MAG TPA: iron-containing alcohol dehydrogenase [Spirochaetia bacterium]|nr:iron-containing alcohol dehydrogenase [Spirochaetia bacterium]
MLTEYVFRTARNIVCGSGSSNHLVTYLGLSATDSSVLLVTQESILSAGTLSSIVDALDSNRIKYEIVTDVGVEPTVENLSQLHQRTKDMSVSWVIGVGGGSVLDAAKILSVLRTNELGVREIIGTDLVKRAGTPLCLIPTTAGTGSEVSPNAIVTIPEEELKIAAVSPFLLPTFSIVDPSLTLTAPKGVTAATGMDAFIHSFESYLSKKANPMSDMYALESIRLISRSILEAYESGSSLKARENMMYGSLYGGMALAAAGTAAVHALAYPLGGKLKIPHGVANAMLLPHVFEFNVEAVGDRVLPIGEAMGVYSGVDRKECANSILQRLRDWVTRLGIPQDLAQWGLKDSGILELALAASKVTRLLVNNPREMSVADIEEVYKKLLPATKG